MVAESKNYRHMHTPAQCGGSHRTQGRGAQHGALRPMPLLKNPEATSESNSRTVLISSTSQNIMEPFRLLYVMTAQK